MILPRADAEKVLGVIQAVGQALAVALGILFIVIQARMYRPMTFVRIATISHRQDA